MKVTMCAQCGVEFCALINRGRALKYCSARCRYTHRDGPRSELLKAARKARKPKKLACEMCGHAFYTKHKRRFCGKACRDRSALFRRGKRVEQACNNCGVRFSRLHEKTHYCCSEECLKERTASRKLASWAKRNIYRKSIIKSGENIDPIEIFMRDGWRCKHCSCKTPANLRGTYDKNAPELDHIVPLSKGGEHIRRNVQLLCRGCNSSKSNGKLADQMLLIG